MSREPKVIGHANQKSSPWSNEVLRPFRSKARSEQVHQQGYVFTTPQPGNPIDRQTGSLLPYRPCLSPARAEARKASRMVRKKR